MLRWFENLKLVYKLLVPLSILICTVVVTLFIAQDGLAELREVGERVIDKTAARRSLNLSIVGQLNGAALQEKNGLLETEPARVQEARTLYETSMAEAFAAVGRLITLADTAEQRALDEELKTEILDFKQLADSAFTLMQGNERAAAAEISRTTMRVARRKAMDVLAQRVQVQTADLLQARAELGALGQSAVLRLYLFAGVGLSLSLALLAVIVTLLIVRPLKGIVGSMQMLASGDLKVQVVGVQRQDEVGSLAQSLQVFKANGLRALSIEAEIVAARAAADAERARTEAERAGEAAEDQAAIDALAQGLDALANGNLTHQITAEMAQKTQRLKDDFNAAAARLHDTMTTITGAIQGMTTGAGEIGQAADDLSRRTEQQAASLEQTAAALDEITAAVRKTAEGASAAQGVVATAKSDADHSSGVVRDAKAAMGEIEGSAQQISQIIGVIDEIAFQTNLLALNAGVEAARAGDAGRGFAVVASEVRALAQRSAEAAKEIKGLIAKSSKQVVSGVKLVDDAGESLQRIAGHVAQVFTAINDIAASAKEQATGLQEVNTAINQMDQVTQQNAAMVEQSTAASHGLAQETAELSRLTGYFRITGPSSRSAAPRPARPAPMAKAGPHRGAAKLPEAASAGDWKEF